MEYRRLGKSGLKVSEIGLGSGDFGSRIAEKESLAVIRQALDAGINFIDTADVYGAQHSEEVIGKAIKGRRSSVIVATKFCLPTGQGPNDYGASRGHIMHSIEASLRRLDTDYIDLYYIHWPDISTPIEETLRTMDNLFKTGKVRYIGCSNFKAWQLCEALWISRVNNLESFIVVQSHYNLLERKIEPELVPCCENYGIGIIPYFPLAGGFLTGKYESVNSVPAGTHLGMLQKSPPKLMPNIHGPGGRPLFGGVISNSDFKKIKTWQQFAKAHNHSLEELAISWLLSHQYVDSVIAGASKPEHVSAHIAATEWKLSTQDLAELEQLTESN